MRMCCLVLTLSTYRHTQGERVAADVGVWGQGPGLARAHEALLSTISTPTF